MSPPRYERPEVMLECRGGEHGPIRRRESLETLLLQEEVPPWLS